MIVVSDTSPLNYLVLIGAIDILPQLFGKIHVLARGIEELKRHRARDLVTSAAMWQFRHSLLSPP